MDTSLTRDTNTCGDVCFNILLHMPLEIITDCHMAWTPPCNVLTIYWTKTLLYHFAKKLYHMVCSCVFAQKMSWNIQV